MDPIAAFMLFMILLYTRLVVHLVVFARLRGQPVSSEPRFTSQDVSVIIPTVFNNSVNHIRCIQSIVACCPRQVIVVTCHARMSSVTMALSKAGLWGVEVLGVDRLNKRAQMVAAVKESATGSVIAFADDDVFWPNEEFLPRMLATFDDCRVGATGPMQRARRHPKPNLWNFLGICYLERRNFNTSTTNCIDGAVSTLSGRTAFYLACVVQNQSFYDFFMHAANQDDDKNLTRWTYERGWRIALQCDPKTCIETTLETNRVKFIQQCLRWARGHWRGNFRVMTTCSYWYKRHPWSLYAIYIAQFQTPAAFWDSLMILTLWNAVRQLSTVKQVAYVLALVAWILLTKTVKIWGHFRRHPADLRFVPQMIAFSYIHGLINIGALITMANTSWGSRGTTTPQLGAGNPDAAALMSSDG